MQELTEKNVYPFVNFFFINDREWSLNFTLSQLMEVQVKMYGEQLLVAVAKTTLGLLRKPHYLLHPVTADDNSSGDKLDGMI